MEGKKILIAILMIGAFLFVWHFAQQSKYDDAYETAVVPEKRAAEKMVENKEKMVAKYDGIAYKCKNGNTIYVSAADGQVEMTLVYPDDAFGMAIFEDGSKEGDAFIFDDGENKLRYDQETATFEINNITVADTCSAVAGN